MEEIKPSQLWNACSKSKIQQKTDFHIIWNISSFFTKMRQILALGGGGGGNLKIVSQRQNMSKCYYAHDPYLHTFISVDG